MTVLILKGDMFSALRPSDGPAAIPHLSDKVFAACRGILCIHDCSSTVHHIAFLLGVVNKVVLILTPSLTGTFFNRRPIEVLPLLGHGQAMLPAHLVCQVLHSLQVIFRCMKLVAIDIVDRVDDGVNMQMVPVLMDSKQHLMTGKGLFAQLFCKIQCLLWRDFFVLMKADDIMGAHPP